MTDERPHLDAPANLPSPADVVLDPSEPESVQLLAATEAVGERAEPDVTGLTTVCLMLKSPRPGSVKTRLAADLGDDADKACAIYQALVEHQRARLPHHWRVVVAYAPGELAAQNRMRKWLGPSLRYQPQIEGDLGQRLTAAMNRLFNAPHATDRLIFLGGDCPYLDESRLLEAERKLLPDPDLDEQPARAVVIPARDGGYCLIGVARPLPRLFKNIEWGSDKVMEQTRKRAEAANVELIELDETEDVDDAATWERAASIYPGLADKVAPKADG